jgi:hypothetical protein
MDRRLIPVFLSALLLLATSCWPAPVELVSPPLRYPDDTRSAFSWAPQSARFPSSASVRVRVVDQYRPTPNPWEVAWVVLGDDRHFIAFVPKPTGWHVEVVDAEATPPQRYLASGSSPAYPAGQPVTVSIAARRNGIEISADSQRTEGGRAESIRLVTSIGWTKERPAPDWWGRPMRAGIYVEDCVAELEWRE